ncbi:FGGY-family carbohydrate kinase [Pseudoteredinibacter isoporae]|uniref:Sugar (Pentulose or hexulose) kinase n=1 Tax=Pseudoteredinibacter isoporae TaxID=570281 RepID=A0A7X0JSL7_9GAMM|nr:FGGY-family carbohydrate kinase [Pseudoteredinibacter isoporae]MBB6521514.1 sugar (pentulose or hexulose) kinase [Pseudoteredinibacter isoporae]NHO87068.1 carbohydrate kinase [Pseudoteredinibacter isoporae]NIB22815.1 carbohydrate kinase [Pseudoteredinibacter isoporae]
MNDKPYVLSIDNGTQSIRALAYDRHGEQIDKAYIPIEAYTSPEPAWAEQSAEYFWQKLCEACQCLWQQGKVKPEQIAALSVTTQRGTVINLDKNGEPLRPAIIWLDQREAPESVSLGWMDWPLKLLGLKSNIDYFTKQAEANWIHQVQPELWQKTHKFLLLSGYHHYRFSGKYIDSVASQVAYIPFDYKQQQWAKDSSWHWRALPLKADMLPELVPAGEVMAEVNEQAAGETGLPAGLPIVASGSDKACELLGAGAVEEHIGCLSYGTTATYNGNFSRYIESAPMIPPYPAATPGRYNTEAMVYRGYWMVSWFKEQMAMEEKLQAKEQGVAVETLFDELLKKVPAGSMGLTLQPYWSPGIKNPGPGAKGAIIGFGDVHTKAHIYRAIIEGLCFALREGKERVEKRSGQKISRLRISGGGSQSDQIMQISADIFGMAVERPATYETSGLGAAINSAVAMNWYPDHKAAAQNMSRVGQTFEPIEANVDVYEQMYRQVYLKMYSALSPLYQSIRKIVNYPSL